jgi:TonB family protein
MFCYAGSSQIKAVERYEYGKLEGESLYYDSASQKISYSGGYHEGKEIGRWQYFYRGTDKLRRVENYENGKLEGEIMSYDLMHTLLRSKGRYNNGHAVGKFVYYYPGTTVVEKELNYKNDSLYGKASYYDSATGHIYSEGTYRNNKRDGKWKYYNVTTQNLVLEENYENGKLDGLRIKYDEKENKENVIRFQDGKENGKVIYYYPGGKKIHIQANVIDDKLEGELLSYYESGQKKRAEKYEKGVSVWGKCFASNGNEVAYYPLFIDAKFEGDVMIYIGNNLHYPDEEEKSGREGKVLVRFTITESGLVKNAEIIEGIGGAFDEEALRIVSQMPPWQPAYIDGNRQETTQTLPLVFWKQEEPIQEERISED